MKSITALVLTLFIGEDGIRTHDLLTASQEIYTAIDQHHHEYQKQT